MHVLTNPKSSRDSYKPFPMQAEDETNGGISSKPSSYCLCCALCIPCPPFISEIFQCSYSAAHCSKPLFVLLYADCYAASKDCMPEELQTLLHTVQIRQLSWHCAMESTWSQARRDIVSTVRQNEVWAKGYLEKETILVM